MLRTRIRDEPVRSINRKSWRKLWSDIGMASIKSKGLDDKLDKTNALNRALQTFTKPNLAPELSGSSKIMVNYGGGNFRNKSALIVL
jgi:hypothetical protein